MMKPETIMILAVGILESVSDSGASHAERTMILALAQAMAISDMTMNTLKKARSQHDEQPS